MKKFATIAFIAASSLALAACGKSDSASDQATADNVEMPADEMPAGDASMDAPAPDASMGVEAPGADASAAADSAADAAQKAADSAASAAEAAKAAAAEAEQKTN